MAFADGLADALEPDERRVGVGRQGKHRRDHRERVAHHLAQPGVGVDEPREHVVAPGRLPEPQPLQELLGRRAVDPGPRHRRPRERLEQGSIEQPLVDPADERRRPVIFALEIRGVGEPEGPGERRSGARVVRQVMGLQVTDDLESVLEPSKEPVRVGQGLGVAPRHVALRRQRPERLQRVRRTERRATR